MSIPIPNSRPQASLTQVMEIARRAWKGAKGDAPLPETFVLAVRGYYASTFAPAGNNVGIYDDAFFIVSPLGFTAWNGNTDPSRYGWNANAGKYMARLALGVYKFVRLKHHASRPDGYMAFGQYGNPVTVERIKPDGSIALTETGCYGINLHRGGVNGTSSEGCNTLPAEQWNAFDRTLTSAIDGKSFPFILVAGPIN